MKVGLVVILVVIAVPLIKYRTVNPCAMLQKERIAEIRDGIESARDEAREAVEGRGQRAERLVEGVNEALEGVAGGLAERSAELEVEEMSTRECVVELWKMRKGD